jgi:hypothetical protein
MRTPTNAATMLVVLLLFPMFGTLAQPRFEIPLTITDRADTLTLYFGILPDAHFCIDLADSINGHFEFGPPPHPPSGLEALFVSPRSGLNPACFDVGSPNDYRPFTSYVQKDTLRVNIWRWPFHSDSIVISWPSGLGAYFRKLTLKDVQSGGTLRTVNMAADTSVDFTDIGTPDFRIHASGPHNPNDTVSVQVQYRAGWNLVSNPFKIVIPGDSVKQLFPMSMNPYAFGYNFGYYFQSYRLVHGKGYWLKLPSETSVTFRGIGYTNDTISVQAGWNLIGTAFYPVPVDSVRTIPPGIITWFFGFESGYARADTLWPGKGYCVRVSQPGLIVLPGGF